MAEARVVPADSRPRFGTRQFGTRGQSRGFGLVVSGSGDGASRDQISIARFVGACLRGAGASRGNRARGSLRGKRVIGRVDPHQRLAPADGLPRLDQPRHDLAADPEGKVALHARPDDSGELAIGAFGGTGLSDPNERRQRAGVDLGLAAPGQQAGQNASERN